ATTSQCTIWTRTCVLAHIPTNFPRSSLLASNAAAISASSKNNLTSTTHLTYDSYGTHETNQKTLDQTDAENRAHFLVVHMLRVRGVMQRASYCVISVNAHSYSRHR